VSNNINFSVPFTSRVSTSLDLDTRLFLIHEFSPLKVPCHVAITDGFSMVCKEICMKPLMSCNHRCSQVCHYGMLRSIPSLGVTELDNIITGSCAKFTCPKLVKITCKCGTKKEKWECAKAQAERKNRKLAARVDSLLECDEKCPKEPIAPVQVCACCWFLCA